MSKIRVSHMGCQRGARSAWLIGAAMLGLAVVPANAGAKQITLERAHLADAFARAAEHANWVASGRPGAERRAVPRQGKGNGLHGVVLSPSTMRALFPILAGTGRTPRAAKAAKLTEADKPAVDALARLAPGVLDQAQRQLAYLLGEWGVKWRGSPKADGSPGDLLAGDARDRANWTGAGYAMTQMDSSRLADLVVRAVQEQARRALPGDADLRGFASAVHANGELAWRVSDSVANEVFLPPLGGLLESSATRGDVVYSALSLLLPDSAEVPRSAKSAPARGSSNGLVIQGTNFVDGSGGYTREDAEHFREHD